MSAQMIYIQSQDEIPSVNKNWRRLSDTLDVQRTIATNWQQVFDQIKYCSSENRTVNHVWMDWEYMDADNALTELTAMNTVMSRLYNMHNMHFVIVVPTTMDVLMLQALAQMDNTSVVVRCDLRIRHVMEFCVRQLLQGQRCLSVSVNKLLTGHIAVYERANERKTRVSWVIPTCSIQVNQDYTQALSADLRISVNTFMNWHTFIKCLVAPTFVTDLLILDVNMLLDCVRLDLYDRIQTVVNVRKSVTADPFRLSVAITDQTDMSTVRSLMRMPGVQGLAPMPLHGFDVGDMKLALTELMQGKFHVPPRVAQKLDAKKQPTASTKKGLTDRQQQIFELVTQQGASNKVIANRLHITESAVKRHVTHLLKKHGVKSRTELAALQSVS